MTLSIGQATIPWSTFKPCSDVKNIIITENGVQEIVGETTEEITEMKWNGDAAYQRIQSMKSEKMGNRTGIIIIDKNTFAPLYYRSFFNDQEIVVEYKGTSIFGSIENDEGAYDFSYILSQPFFDTMSVEMVLRVLPLEVGYSTSLNAFKSFTQEEMNVVISVVGEDEIYRGEGQAEMAWKVDVTFGSHMQTYWIGKTTGGLLKQSVSFENGSIMEFVRKS